MRKLFYAGAMFTTGDDIAYAFCEAVLRVSVSGRAEQVEVPCRRVDSVESVGEVSIATIVVVPGIAVVTVHHRDELEELVDSTAVRQLQRVPPLPRARTHDAEGYSPDVEATYDFDEWM